MKYFFILGSNPTLSLAELTAIFSNDRFSLVQKNIAILASQADIKSDIIKKIGGTVKFGLIHNELASLATKDILKSVAAFAKPEKSQTKFNFGISFYGKAKIHIKTVAMEFKKLLKQSGINSRWVISREPTLSSVVVEQNKLVTNKGVEIVIIEFNKKLLLGKTLAVQPFKELSFRDYGRPARDDRSGMLPPKLAQIMLNLALTPPLTPARLNDAPPERLCRAGSRSGGKGDGGILLSKNNITILDPFCGSGTILTEAMLMGYRNLIGSDISSKAIGDTRKNIEWIEKNFQFSIFNFQLINANAEQISKHIAPNSIDAIITEPYLGPQRGLLEINKIIRELENLYSNSLKEFNKILKPGGRIVMIWPVFQRVPSVIPAQAGIQKGIMAGSLNPNLNGFTILNPFPANLQKNIFLKLTARHTIIYGREGQKVWREIVILEKQN